MLVDRAQRRARRAMTLGLWITLGLTLWNLPTASFPPIWIAAFTLPAWLFLLLGQLQWLPVLWRLALCTVFQVSAAYVATSVAGHLEHAAALACTLLPPTTYVALRRQDSDVTLALFLGFCLQLVGIMLARQGFGMLTACWVVAAAWTLHLETRLSAFSGRHQSVPSREPGPVRVARAGLLALSCGILALGAFRLLSLLPDRSDEPATQAPRAAGTPNPDRVEVGLSNQFQLGGATPGTELTLRANQLVRAVRIDGALSEALYLRSAAFHTAGLSNWLPGETDLAPLPADGAVRAPFAPGTEEIQQLAIHRLGPQKGVVYAPPGVTRFIGTDAVLGDPSRGHFFEPEAADDLNYEVEFQDLRTASRRRPTVRGGAALTQLPPELRTSEFTDLHAEIARSVPSNDPAELCAAIAEFLAVRCTYDRREPVGPYAAPLLNFLHGERHGYCMHFASAAAILLRTAGIPCRIAVGLYGGEPDPAVPGGRVYGSQHGHAWVELPIAGMGWVVYDPTPPGSRATGDIPGLDEALGIDSASADGEGDASWWSTVPTEVWAWAAGLAVALVWWLRPRVRRAAIPVDARQAWPARTLLLQILRHLSQKGLSRHPRETLEQYQRSLRTQLRRAGMDLDPRLSEAFAAYQEVRFGARPWDARRQSILREGVRAAAALTRPVEPAAEDAHHPPS